MERAPSLREGFATGDIACMPKLGGMRRRAVVAVLGALYFLVSLPLAETGGNLLGGVCTSQAIWMTASANDLSGGSRCLAGDPGRRRGAARGRRGIPLVPSSG